jgi:hypothetical protein
MWLLLIEVQTCSIFIDMNEEYVYELNYNEINFNLQYVWV